MARCGLLERVQRPLNALCGTLFITRQGPAKGPDIPLPTPPDLARLRANTLPNYQTARLPDGMGRRPSAMAHAFPLRRLLIGVVVIKDIRLVLVGTQMLQLKSK